MEPAINGMGTILRWALTLAAAGIGVLLVWVGVALTWIGWFDNCETLGGCIAQAGFRVWGIVFLVLALPFLVADVYLLKEAIRFVKNTYNRRPRQV